MLAAARVLAVDDLVTSPFCPKVLGEVLEDIVSALVEEALVPFNMVSSGATKAKINLLNPKPLEQPCSQFQVVSIPNSIGGLRIRGWLML